MKKIIKLLLCALFAIFATSPEAMSENLNPFAMNIEGIDPDAGTAAKDDIFRDVNDLEGFEGSASEFVAPAWLEVLTLISPANYPISTFLTQKTLDGIRGLAKAESMSGKHEDVLFKTDAGNSRFNSKYRVKKDVMRNDKQFSEEGVKNYKLNWGDIAVLPFQDATTAEAFGTPATSGNINVANVNMWKVGHTVKIQNAVYATSQKPLNVYVGAVDVPNNRITVYSLGTNGSENIPTIASGTQITRMGAASAEGAVKAAAVTQSPTSDYNYAQKFIVSVVYSNWMMMTQLFTNYSFSMITNLALQDFRYGQEFSFMFGTRGQQSLPVEGGGSERINLTGGLVDYVDQVIEYGTGSGNTTITEADIVEFTKEMRVGNNGSDTRFLYAGSELISSLNKGIMKDSTRYVQKESEVIYGLSFTSLYSFFGTINVMYAPLMDQSEYRDRGFLLDMLYIDKFVFQPFHQNEVDLKKLREYDGHSVDMIETCGLVVRNKPTHFEMQVKA